MDFKEEIIRCRSCDKNLFSILLLDGDLPSYKVGKKIVDIDKQTMTASCPYCGDKSWSTTVTQRVMMSPVDGLHFTEIDQDRVVQTPYSVLNVNLTLGKLK
jgi:hypothetical protein